MHAAGDGCITKKEWRFGVKGLGVVATDAACDEVFDKLDADG
jgi:Ca2+-binding EF-hand superfamily protein